MNKKSFVVLLALFCMSCTEKDAEKSPSDTDEVVSDELSCTELCSLALECPNVEDAEIIFKTNQEECEAACTDEMSWSMLQCTQKATNCGDLSACTTPTSSEDIGICESACTLVVDTCSLSTDIGQCTIDCSMTIEGFGGPFYTADLMCWETAVANEDCEHAQQCRPIYY